MGIQINEADVLREGVVGTRRDLEPPGFTHTVGLIAFLDDGPGNPCKIAISLLGTEVEEIEEHVLMTKDRCSSIAVGGTSMSQCCLVFIVANFGRVCLLWVKMGSRQGCGSMGENSSF